MTRDQLVGINSTLRDAIEDIEDIVSGLELSAQSTLNMEHLGDDNDRLEAALAAIIVRATDGLTAAEEDDED
jgi:hypothetical protein